MVEKEVEQDCEKLKNALKKKDGDKLVKFVLSKSKNERQEIREAYKACWGVDLGKDIDKSLSGNFKQTMLALFLRPAEYDAECLYKAMKGLGTDEDTLIEIICTRGNESLKDVIEEFNKKYPDYTLESWVRSETSGSFRNLLVSLLQCKRKENAIPDDLECEKLAKELYDVVQKKLGTDEPIFNKIFVISSPAELLCISEKYEQIYNHSLRLAVEKEYSGDCKNALITILDGVINPAEYFARKVNKAIKGLGTDDTMLIRVLVSREGIDMLEMKNCYSNIFKIDMIEDIKDDTFGNYQKLLVGLASGY